MNSAPFRRRRLRLLIAACVAAAGLAVAGCGSSGNDSGSGATTASGAAAAGLARAEATVAKLSRRPAQTIETTALPKIPAGTRMVYLKCGVPACESYLAGATAAAQRLGIPMRVLDAGNAPQDQAKAWDQAVSEAPAAVLEVGFQLDLFGQQMGELAAKRIPIVSGGDTGRGLAGNVQPPATFEEIGGRQADYVIAKSHGKAHVVFLWTPEIPLVASVKAGFERRVHENCPDCKLDLMQVQLRDIGRAIPAQVVSYMQQHPDTDWIAVGFGDLAAGVPEALKGASISNVQLTSGAGGKVNWGYIKDGNAQVMDLAVDDVMLGWWMVDRAVRAIGGQDGSAPAPLVQQYLTKDTLDFDLNKGWTAVDGYPDKFAAKWSGPR
jgi:ribose transport system substrate-binding protein